jgi:hypothetical protein
LLWQPQETDKIGNTSGKMTHIPHCNNKLKEREKLITDYRSLKLHPPTRCQWLTPIILATQEAEIRRIWFTRPYLEKTHHKKELVEWLK